jgi:nicotinamidase/pyrazinamidase
MKKEKIISFDVDSQNGFTSNCPDELPVHDGQNIVDELNLNATYAQYRFMSKDAHPENGIWTATKENPQFSPVGEKDVDIRWNQHCVVGTYGFELIDGLPHPSEYDYLVYKGVERDMHPYSPIYHDLNKTISTGVIEMAKALNVDTFIVGGLATDYCVKEAVLDLKEAGFNIILNQAATRGVTEDLSEIYTEFEKKGIMLAKDSTFIGLLLDLI